MQSRNEKGRSGPVSQESHTNNEYAAKEEQYRTTRPIETVQEPIMHIVPVKNRTGKVSRSLLPALVLLTVFSIGMFAGWQFGSKRIAIGNIDGLQGGNDTGILIAPFTENRAEAVREAVIAKVRPTVVQVNVNKGQSGMVAGSGVIIDKRGYIVTNEHVIAGGKTIEVVLFNGTTRAATLVGSATDDDIAILKIATTGTKLHTISLGDSAKLQVGQDVLAIGNPLGITQTVTNGIVSALDRSVATGKNGTILRDTIQTDAAINPGNSGGALVDLQGSLIGIPTLTAIDPQFKTLANGLGFAIPANRVKVLAPQIIRAAG